MEFNPSLLFYFLLAKRPFRSSSCTLPCSLNRQSIKEILPLLPVQACSLLSLDEAIGCYVDCRANYRNIQKTQHVDKDTLLDLLSRDAATSEKYRRATELKNQCSRLRSGDLSPLYDRIMPTKMRDMLNKVSNMQNMIGLMGSLSDAVAFFSE